MSDEAKLKEEYAAEGVDLEELADNPEEPSNDDAPKDEPKEPKATEEPTAPEEKPEEPKELPDEPKEQRKRSIYDEYKEKKSELKTERELREKAEAERDELKQLVEDREKATTDKERKDADDEIAAFAKKINADPATLREMQQLFTKDQQPAAPTLSDDDRAALAKAREIQEAQLFEQEFSQVQSTLKEFVPNATDAEMQAIKGKLDELAHSKEWHDKSLDYIAFKNRDVLTALTSPKKRGLEGKSRQDAPEATTDFNPEADISKMSAKELEAWEKEYNKLTTDSGLITDAEGRKMII